MYSTQTATDIEDIPALIRAFAADRGWTVNGDAITRPGGGIAWTISAEKQSFGYHIIRVYQDGLTGSAERHTFTCLPRLRGTSGNPQVLTPSKVHLFGNEDPFDGPDSEPFIVCVIECGYNHYRHVYIGGVVKFGDFTGGDCICMNFVNQYYSGGSPKNSWSSDWSKFMFSAKHSANSGSYAPPVGDRAGGVLIDHADNARPWRWFDGPYGASGSLELLNGSEVFGGHSDGVNDGLVYRGTSDYAGANILVPVNLYCSDGDYDEDYRIRPVGMVSGARLINMDGLDPGSSIQVGNRNWRVFPEFRKTLVTSYGILPGNAYWEDETSYLLGLAYPED